MTTDPAPRTRPARKRAATETAAPAAGTDPAVTPDTPAATALLPLGATGLLQAGLKALSGVREDVLERRSRVFSALLGKDTPAGGEMVSPPLDDVFDARVARTLEQLGYPSAQTLQELFTRMEHVIGLLEETSRRMAAAAEPAPAPPAPVAAPRKRARKT